MTTKLGIVSVAGRNSKNEEKDNQDFALSGSSTLREIVIVCDGAGSTLYGALGSKWLSHIVLKDLSSAQISSESEFREIILKSVNYFREVIKRLIKLYKLEVKIGEFATTLILVSNESSQCSYVAHIGDGACLFISETFKDTVFSSLPENGEYANQTYFITDKNYETRLRTFVVNKTYSACLIMSDGITPMALKKNQPFWSFVSPILHFMKSKDNTTIAQALSGVLTSESSMKVSSDDKSIGWIIKC